MPSELESVIRILGCWVSRGMSFALSVSRPRVYQDDPHVAQHHSDQCLCPSIQCHQFLQTLSFERRASKSFQHIQFMRANCKSDRITGISSLYRTLSRIPFLQKIFVLNIPKGIDANIPRTANHWILKQNYNSHFPIR